MWAEGVWAEGGMGSRWRADGGDEGWAAAYQPKSSSRSSPTTLASGTLSIASACASSVAACTILIGLGTNSLSVAAS